MIVETECLMNQGEIRLAVIGCGGFGLYALQQFAQVPGVKLVGMAGTHREAALAAAQRFGIPDIEDVDKLLARDDVDLVYIATPPFLHYPQATGRARGRQARHLRETAGDDGRAGRRHDRGGKEERPVARGQPDAAVQPAVTRRSTA